MKSNGGFSLIEILVSISIIAMIGLFSSALISRSFRSTTQTDLLSILKQNGQLAIGLMEEDIKNAEAVMCYSSTGDRIVIRTLAGKYNRYRFVPSSSTQNGYIAKQEDLSPVMRLYFCTTDPPQNEIVLTDTNSSTGVSISNGQFVGIPGAGGKDTVTIRFNVNRPVSYVGTGTDIVPIQTTVQVRNEGWR